MSNKPSYWQKAIRHLSDADPVMAGIIAQYKGETLQCRGDAYFTLMRSIVGQQISVKAADSVWNKLATSHEISPRNILKLSEADLRACGLSGQKAAYMRNISEHFVRHKISHGHWDAQDDEAVIADLSSIKGVGRWTVEMFLIFHLMRPDVFPIADIGLQKGIQKHYKNKKELDKSAMQKLATKWQPYRTVATWYLWRSLDPVPVEY